MLSYKKILVPYDGSEHAKKALQQAIAIAEDGEGAKLFVASVCNMVSAMSNFDQVSIAEGCLTTKLTEDLEAQCKADLEEAKALIPKAVETEMIYEVGSPGPVLLNVADDKKCDLIVMGSRGQGGVKGFLGSVSYAVVQGSPIAVLIAKDAPAAATKAGATD